ncbi:transporter substrate-binding domain-containing protein [Vogesella sp. DC21W]|uniref:Transporter substrate-binding domain-containing protein n=1 Tax=Vogesella aquatica TaxID=2984206 RepID=A0ABT5IXH2_9NEIS|nr:transporter substrate-binding domain-containing protein [Vogesella aquatica]MDC7717269.1 transporter substrate-binding domain-containing protein [Vogesella aquatica]
MLLHGLMILVLLLPAVVHAAVVKVCAEAWPPFLYRDDAGRVAGMAASWIAQAASKQHVRVQYQFLSLQACRKLAASGGTDALAFTPSKEQLEGWLLTKQPMVFWVLSAFVPYHSPHKAFSSLSQFSGLRVGWGQHYRYPDRLVLQSGWSRVPAYDAEALFTLLIRNKIDVVFEDERYVASSLPLQSRRLMRALHPVAASMPQPVAVRPGLAGFAQALDDEALRWQRSGQLDYFYRTQYGVSLATIQAAGD